METEKFLGRVSLPDIRHQIILWKSRNFIPTRIDVPYEIFLDLPVGARLYDLPLSLATGIESPIVRCD